MSEKTRRCVVLGVTGGIACYKSCELVSRLSKAGVDVYVIMTENAARFVTPLTFETMSNHPVVTDTFERPETWEVAHVALAKAADVILPLTVERVREELQYIRKTRIVTPAGLSSGGLLEDNVLQIITFGNFEVFFHDRPLNFRYSRTKELLAYLVDRRGSMCSNREISAVLWEDDDYKKHMSYFSNLRNDLMTTLGRIGRSDAILHKRGMMGINMPAVRCDLFSCLYIMKNRGGTHVSAEEVAYRGEYMNQYSWAEETNSVLDRLLAAGW